MKASKNAFNLALIIMTNVAQQPAESGKPADDRFIIKKIAIERTLDESPGTGINDIERGIIKLGLPAGAALKEIVSKTRGRNRRTV